MTPGRRGQWQAARGLPYWRAGCPNSHLQGPGPGRKADTALHCPEAGAASSCRHLPGFSHPEEQPPLRPCSSPEFSTPRVQPVLYDL